MKKEFAEKWAEFTFDSDAAVNHDELCRIALEAVRLAREDERNLCNKNVRESSEEMKFDMVKEVEARVAKKIFESIEKQGFIQFPFLKTESRYLKFKKRFLESEKSESKSSRIVEGQKKKTSNSASKDSKYPVGHRRKSCCGVCEPDSGRDVDLSRRLKKEAIK